MELAREEQRYAAQYCEENAWYLARRLLGAVERDDEGAAAPAGRAFVVVVSNKDRRIPLWRQGRDPHPVVWDYHVFVAVLLGKESWVYDLDTTLAFPCTGTEYFREAMRPDIPLKDSYRRCFRVVDATDYVAAFSSDRRHMLDPGADGAFLAAPPPWDCIRGEASTSAHDLPYYWTVQGHGADDSPAPGRIMDEPGFHAWLCGADDAHHAPVTQRSRGS